MLMNPFVKNTAVLTAGSAAAQLLPVVITPLLARLYSAQAFGSFSLYLSAVNIITQCVCLKYEMAIVSCKTQEDAAKVTRLCMAILALATAFSALAGLFLGGQLVKEKGAPWQYSLLFALGALGIGWFEVLNYSAVFQKKYQALARANWVKAAISSALQLALFFLGGMGLMLAQSAGYFAGAAVLHGAGSFLHRKTGEQPKSSLWETAKKYKDFPLYSMPGAAANAAAFGQISFWVSFAYSSQELGAYAMINRVLSAPLALLSSAAGQVFFQQAAEEYRHKGRIASFPKVWAGLVAVSTAGFGTLFFLLPWGVSLFLGPQWAQCAAYGRILLPLYGVRFVCTPLLFTAVVTGRQKEMMIWQLFTLGATAAVLGAAAGSRAPFHIFLFLCAAVFSALYLVFTAFCCGWALKGPQTGNRPQEAR